jgi:hypothetical protein
MLVNDLAPLHQQASTPFSQEVPSNAYKKEGVMIGHPESTADGERRGGFDGIA